jgi:hypothetical protein
MKSHYVPRCEKQNLLLRAHGWHLLPVVTISTRASTCFRVCLRFIQDGQIVSMKDGLCMTLVDGDTCFVFAPIP